MHLFCLHQMLSDRSVNSQRRLLSKPSMQEEEYIILPPIDSASRMFEQSLASNQVQSPYAALAVFHVSLS